MGANDPAVRSVLRRAMVARIATLSRSGRPNINPLYFVVCHDRIWLGTASWTLAARNVQADPRVSLLLDVEQGRMPGRVLRLSGHASVRTNPEVMRPFVLRAARKYYGTPGGLRHMLAHLRQVPAMRAYHAQGREKGQPCVIEVIAERAEFLEPLD